MNIPVRTAARRHLRWYSIAGWSLLALLCAAFFVYTLTVSLGAVHGIEFCPQTFDRRSYSFFEIPFLRLQVTGVRRETLSKTAETYLQSNKLVVPPSGKQEWHLVEGVHGPRPPHRGDAAILLKYLDATDSGDEHRWIKWSTDHKELAKILWPAVQKFAIYDLYVFLPDLFDIAKTSDDPQSLKSKLDEVSANKLLFLARRLAEGDSPARAIEALDEAAALQGETTEIKTLRDQWQSQTKAGEKKP